MRSTVVTIYTRAKRLQTARLSAGLRQSDVAKEMNRSVSTIKKWEQEDGPSPATLEDIAKLCQILNISIDYYINGRQHRARFTKADVRLIELVKKMLPGTRQHFEDIAKILIEIQDRDKSQSKD